jgi:hypothetical protein
MNQDEKNERQSPQTIEVRVVVSELGLSGAGTSNVTNVQTKA